MTGFDAVVFDLFHTLVDPEDFRPPNFRRLNEVADIIEVDLEPFSAFWAETSRERTTTPIRTVDLVARFAEGTGKHLSDNQRIAVDDIMGRYQDLAIANPRPGIIALVGKLVRHVRLGLVSNCHEREVRSWPTSPLAPMFTSVGFSHETGFRKPELESYFSVLHALDVDPARAAFVGNGGSGELSGARLAGFGLVVHCNVFDAHNDLVDSSGQRQRRAQADVSAQTITQLGAALSSER